ncbi:type II toxin-antitoxin system VapC family toxin [Phytohabitans flavus]|uniref:Ribonuclease VapC n=1 Tax=Phytohabitans flavus TaxID=1076124 RepID=A0A6F8XJI8_9ACTN|nr:type II toxin-antitoxin system VapC family toxin [Phytohabitans flavus]BCB73972.1 ribonuclease VapC [Phytohabitans flavus]
MIVDSSAIVAILLQEPGWEPLLDRLVGSEDPAGVGAPTLVETGIVLAARLGIPGKTLLARFIQESSLRVISFTADHWPVAVDAYLRYGKGRHPAALNFGDCLTYAVGRVASEPLLCLGNDFARTDLSLVEV